jgi:ABC-type Fe3+-hydroxamate transport system substrate-binding protein
MYEQGKKDGARKAFEELDDRIAKLKEAIPHRTPGRPRKKK